MTLERSTWIISSGCSSLGILSLAAALINARTGYAVSAAVSAITSVGCVWVLLYVQRHQWMERVKTLQDIAEKTNSCAMRSVDSAIEARKAVEEVRALLEPFLEQTRAPAGVIHDQA